MLPEHVDYGKRNIPNITKDSMRKVRGTGVGYYTFRFNQLFGKADDVFFCRLESLREDLVAFFDGIGAGTDELCDYVRSLDKKNTSEHAPESTYYTAELAELVRIRDWEWSSDSGSPSKTGFRKEARIRGAGLDPARGSGSSVTPMISRGGIRSQHRKDAPDRNVVR